MTWLTTTLAMLFLCSGACALVYQILWLRLLGLVFGVTVFAASTVWASFMAGLAIGSLVGGRIGDHVRRPLVWFGAAEMLVGAAALASLSVFDQLQQFYVTVFPTLSFPLATLARACMAFGVLVLPTTLMGITLPLIVRSTLFRSEQLGTNVALLYGMNTGGAIAGTLAAGLYLIPVLGIQSTFRIAAAVNLLIGIIAIALSFRRSDATAAVLAEPARQPPAGRDPHEGAMPDHIRRLILLTFFISGFTSLALEVIWFRVIILIVRPTVYSFSVMLGTVLLGISFGSFLITSVIRRRTDWLTVLATLEITIGFTALISLATLNQVPVVSAAIEPFVANVMPAYLAYPIAGSIPALLPTAVLLGAAFPIGLRLWAAESQEAVLRSASRVGVFSALNVCGAIIGSLLAGFVLIPQLGARSSLIGIAALPLGTGLTLLIAGRPRSIGRGIISATAIVLFCVGSLSVNDPFEAFLAVRYPSDQLLWREEGAQATVSVHKQRGGGLGLYVEGNHQASDASSMVYVHRRIGHLPLVLHADPRRALVVGLGGGATAGAASLHRGVDLTVVELSESVVRAAGYFEHINHGVLRKRNVDLRIDDGRNHLLLAPGRYDVITADIILPIHAGSNNLYSAEYFRLMRRALRPGGLVLQWVWGTDAEYKTIMRTFLSVFPHTSLWADGSLMIGSEQPLRLRREDFDSKRKIEDRRLAMAELGTNSFEDLLRLYVAGTEALRRYAGAGPILTDDLPLVEYFLSLPRDKQIDLSGLKGDVRDILTVSYPFRAE